MTRAQLREKIETSQSPRAVVQQKPIAKRRTEKDVGIESLRGVAIVMVVLCHVILDHKNPLYPGNKTFLETLQHLCLSTEYIRMPLFTVISGFVYALRPAVASRVVDFVRGKARRLLVPFLFVTSVIVLGRGLLTSATMEGMLQTFGFSLLNPIAHLWFLPSIFLSIVTVGVLDMLGWLSTVRRWGFFLIAMMILEVTYFQTHVFGITHVPVTSGFVLLLPFFTLGCGLNRFGDAIFTRKILWMCATIVVVGLLYQQYMMFASDSWKIGKETPEGLIVGLAGTTLLVYFRPQALWLARLGKYSYSIYLYHFLFISIVLRIIPDDPTGHTQFAARFVAALLMPILLENILMRSKPLRLICLGLK